MMAPTNAAIGTADMSASGTKRTSLSRSIQATADDEAGLFSIGKSKTK